MNLIQSKFLSMKVRSPKKESRPTMSQSSGNSLAMCPEDIRYQYED